MCLLDMYTLVMLNTFELIFRIFFFIFGVYCTNMVVLYNQLLRIFFLLIKLGVVCNLALHNCCQIAVQYNDVILYLCTTLRRFFGLFSSVLDFDGQSVNHVVLQSHRARCSVCIFCLHPSSGARCSCFCYMGCRSPIVAASVDCNAICECMCSVRRNVRIFTTDVFLFFTHPLRCDECTFCTHALDGV